MMLTLQNRSTGLEREEGKDSSLGAGSCLREVRRSEELFELLPQV